MSLGSSFGIKGIELNFWMKPQAMTADLAEYDIISFVNKFIMTIEYVHATPDQFILRTYMGNRAGVVNDDYFVEESIITKNPADATFDWLNINMMIKFSFFCEINIYKGVDYEQMAPRHT